MQIVLQGFDELRVLCPMRFVAPLTSPGHLNKVNLKNMIIFVTIQKLFPYHSKIEFAALQIYCFSFGSAP